eukprot:TRINITY_DN27961_c0_g1_i1.p1 TRINITY_DN27961_c0_g1~~TRINITY_DN27961_c0_g1_i1.p1  ORF type:complete len:233 (-),score=16.98 TRINITY_DN27961_c0_g1_i1:214-912(-)
MAIPLSSMDPGFPPLHQHHVPLPPLPISIPPAFDQLNPSLMLTSNGLFPSPPSLPIMPFMSPNASFPSPMLPPLLPTQLPSTSPSLSPSGTLPLTALSPSISQSPSLVPKVKVQNPIRLSSPATKAKVRSDPSARVKHNNCELRRRTIINGMLDELRELVPSCTMETAKAEVLVEAVAYIKSIQARASRTKPNISIDDVDSEIRGTVENSITESPNSVGIEISEYRSNPSCI